MRLLLISLDGLWEKDFSVLQGLPYLGGMIRTGVSCKNVQTIYPALTYPVHATILTGCFPALHGIGHNQPFAPDTVPEMRPWHWDAASIRKPTLHQLIREKGGKTASILWPVTGKNPYIRRNFPEMLALPGENQTLKMLRYGSAAWLLATELRYGKRRKSIHQPDLDEYAALLAEKLLLSHRPPDFMTLHLVDCDEMRHLHGVDSPQAQAALRRLDSRVGQLLNVLDRKGMGRDTVVAVVSDHGLADVSRPVSLEDALRKADLLHICRAQSTGMGAFLHITDESAKNAARVEAFLKEKQQQLGISRIYGPQELKAMGAAEHLVLAVEAAGDVVFVDDLAREKREKATHGFGPDHPAAQCLFLMTGPGIARGKSIPRAEMVDIAPTLMRAIGHEMPSAQGKALMACFEKSTKSGEL